MTDTTRPLRPAPGTAAAAALAGDPIELEPAEETIEERERVRAAPGTVAAEAIAERGLPPATTDDDTRHDGEIVLVAGDEGEIVLVPEPDDEMVPVEEDDDAELVVVD